MMKINRIYGYGGRKSSVGSERKHRVKYLEQTKTMNLPILVLFDGDTDRVETEPPLRRLGADNGGLINS